MSVYSLASSDRNIFNLPKKVEGLDINTRNSYNATILGYEAGTKSIGNLATYVGYRAGFVNTNGASNVYVGAYAGNFALGDDNLVLGTMAGFNLGLGSRNIMLGNECGYNISGNNNILIGYQNTNAVLDIQESHCNIAIGYKTTVNGYNNIALGMLSLFNSYNSIMMGNNIEDYSSNSILIGNRIINRGRNSLIINNRHNSNNVSFSNELNNYMNINDYMIVSRDESTDESSMILQSDSIRLIAKNVAFQLFNANIEFGAVMKFTGQYSELILDKYVYLGIYDDANETNLTIESNLVYLGGSNVQDFLLYGSNSYLYLNSNLMYLSNQYTQFNLNSNTIKLGSSNINDFSYSGSNVSFYVNSNIYSFSNKYFTFALDSNTIKLGSSNIKDFTYSGSNTSMYLNSNLMTLSNKYLEFNLSSNAIKLGSSNIQNYIYSGSNVSLLLNSNAVSLSNKYLEVTLNSNNIFLGSSNIKNITYSGSNVWFYLNSNVVALSNKYFEFSLDSNTIRLGSSNIEDYIYSGCNVSFFLNSNIASISNQYSEVFLDNRSIRIGGTNNQDVQIYGANNSLTMSNGGVYLDSELCVYRNTYLSNNLVLNKTGTFMDKTAFYNDMTINADAYFRKNIDINTNSTIYARGNVSISNDDYFYIAGAGETRVQQNMQTTNIYVRGKESFCNMQQRNVNWDNITDKEVQELYGSSIIQKNLFVGGMIYSPGLNVSERLVLVSSNNQWSQYVSITSNANPYLVFESSTGTTIKLGDDFTPEIINFTGKHRCSTLQQGFKTNIDNLLGKIVIATGDYNNLDNKYEISIDEAIPIIKLASTKYDSRAFGVISGCEEDTSKRIYRLGNIHFETNKPNSDIKVIVNSVGEGGIWVCDRNGNLKNGDLITTSDIDGYGMRQDNNIITSYTVAKITCDCNFDESGVVREQDTFWNPKITTVYEDSMVYRIAFVGCVYKF